jgi:cellobiose dehydrogenase (acceptor)
LVAADRLSEAGKKVLLIEKGGPSLGFTGGTTQPDWLKGTNVGALNHSIVSIANRKSYSSPNSTFLDCSRPCSEMVTRTGGARVCLSFTVPPELFTYTIPDINVFAGCLLGGGTAINGGLYWYPPDSDFSVANGWPSSWTNHSPYTNKMKARLPSTDVPSPDGKRYLVQLYNVMRDLLQPLGYRNLTINNAPNEKDHVFGYSAFNVGGFLQAYCSPC